MAKDKKSKTDTKKAKLAEKKQKQEKKADKKAKVKASKNADDSDVDDVDLDAVLDEYRRQQEQFHKITEAVVDAPPRPRAAATLMANPANANQLLLFGGEYFNGALATFFNDLMVYYIDRDEWRAVTSPNAPLPRSGHAWTRGGNDSTGVYLFGGEFSSPKQGTFYHYNDFWRHDPTSREWARIEAKGKTPPARSGHRMTYYKNYIVLFGGFQDTAASTKYLSDLWLYDTQNYVWHSPTLPPAQLKPDARSSFTFLPHDQGAVLYGGYSRVKASVAAGNTRTKGGAAPGQRNVLKPMVHQDCFFLRITQPPADGPAGAPPTVRWEKRKKPANTPNPARSGATMAYHKGRGIQFGGVHDVEESEEGIESEFFNQLFAWNVERNRFFPLALRKPRAQGKKGGGGEQRPAGGRRGRAQANEEELLRQLAALQAGAGGAMDVDEVPENKVEEEAAPARREMPVSMEMPHPRFNAQLAVQDDVLYIYGGTFEKGDREFTFDDMYAVDLGKMDGCKEIWNRPVEDWVVRSPLRLPIFPANPAQESEEEDDDDDDDEYEDEDDSEDPDADGDVDMSKFTPSKRGKQPSISTAPSETTTTEDDETEDSTTATSPVDDGLPHPRVSPPLPHTHPLPQTLTPRPKTALRIPPRLLPAHLQRVARDPHDQPALEEHRARDAVGQGDQGAGL